MDLSGSDGDIREEELEEEEEEVGRDSRAVQISVRQALSGW